MSETIRVRCIECRSEWRVLDSWEKLGSYFEEGGHDEAVCVEYQGTRQEFSAEKLGRGLTVNDVQHFFANQNATVKQADLARVGGELAAMVLSDRLVDEDHNPDLPTWDEWKEIRAKAAQFKSRHEAK